MSAVILCKHSHLENEQYLSIAALRCKLIIVTLFPLVNSNITDFVNKNFVNLLISFEAVTRLQL